MTASQVVDVQRFIDENKVSNFQIIVVVLCFLITTLDGFDVGVIGSLAPSIKAEWGLSGVELGRLFGVGLFGLTLGALVFGPLVDRFGRRPILMLAVAGFGIFSFASGYSNSIGTLVVLRFITGFCLGGAMPNAITLTSEYAPAKHRFLMLMAVSCGFTIGGGLGGIVAAHFVAGAEGWRHVLMLGGILPILLLLPLWLALPESIRYLVTKNRGHDEAARVLGRIAPDERLQNCTFSVVQYATDGSPIANLFARGIRGGTLLLWFTFFMGLLLYYLLTSWLPTVINGNGSSLKESVLLAAMFPIGSTVGAIILGLLMDRFNPYKVLTTALFCAGACVTAIGYVYGTWWMLGIAIFGAGFGTGGAVIGLDALAAAFYPVAMRGTGVSWALGVGRMGSIIGSMAGGVLLSLHWDLSGVFTLVAVPAFLGCFTILGMGRLSRKKIADEKAVHAEHALRSHSA
ncbi:MAG TPA: aromatic acid/H+ symport family MFS transporter [Herbaspirillum sp.]|jgi:AAHS family 4-hydroxybenzoate transporter-like MFS transporter